MDDVDTSTTSRRREASAAAVAGSSVALVAVIGGSATSAALGHLDGRRTTTSEGGTVDGRRCSRSAAEDEAWFGRKPYPFALVLRLRVLQIVCGISAMVMGTVGLIEERGKMNLGIGVPAGAATVIAAAASIHGSRGFGGYRPPSPPRRPADSTLASSGVERRSSPPIVDRIAAAVAPGRRHCRRLFSSAGRLSAALWAVAACLCCALVAEGVIALARTPVTDEDEDPWMKPHKTLATVACVQLVLALTILTSLAAALHIRCFGDPDAVAE